MTFRRIAPIFFLLFLLAGCKSVGYYQSKTNPANIGLILEAPKTIYADNTREDSIKFYLVNYNTDTVIISAWFQNLWLVGWSRFYQKELMTRPEPADLRMPALVLTPGDTILVTTKSVQSIFNETQNWFSKEKASHGPHWLSKKKFHPYIQLAGEFKVEVPNQSQVIRIRTGKEKIWIKKSDTPFLKNKKSTLSLTSDVENYDPSKPAGTLNCVVTNTGQYPINLLVDPGSVRFKLYAYNPNRTAVMHTEFILDNGKLPLSPISIQPNGSTSLNISLEEVLYKKQPENAIYYWTWNKKHPPISPLILGKKDIVPEVEFWFGITIDGQEFISNSIHLNVQKTKLTRAGKK